MDSNTVAIGCVVVLFVLHQLQTGDAIQAYITGMPLQVWHWPTGMHYFAGPLYFKNKKAIRAGAERQASRLKKWLQEHMPEMYSSPAVAQASILAR